MNPPPEPVKRINVTLTPSEIAALDEIAKKRGLTRSAAIAAMVRDVAPQSIGRKLNESRRPAHRPAGAGKAEQ